VIALSCTLIVDVDGTIIPILIDFEELRSRVRSVLGVNESLRPLGESLHKLPLNESLKKEAWRIIEEAELDSVNRLNVNDVKENIETIKWAISIGVKLIIVTTRSYRTTRLILEKLNLANLAIEIVTRDFTPIRVDQLKYVKEKYGDRVVFIGDTIYDENAAREVGVEFMRVENFKELPKAIKRSIHMCLEGRKIWV
jgi:HAD superfamily hydrolase (TIGR01549 family)